MNTIFKIGDLVTYCGVASVLQNKIGIVCDIRAGAKRSAEIWCLFGDHEYPFLPRQLRLIKKKKKK